MTTRVARLQLNGAPVWVVETAAGLLPIPGDYPTTRAFFEQGGETAAMALADAPKGDAIDPAAAEWLSPVTQDAEFVCQATNYANHVREVGRDPATIINNVLFRKASSSIASPDTDIVRPAHVRLLDYEIELGLVLRKGFDGPVKVTTETVGEWVGGLVIVNDVSARDVQISHEQFHKAKSYRTFGPVGPWLVLLPPQDESRIGDLLLTLSVNGKVRQRDYARDMIFAPPVTLTELSEIMDLNPGDLIATGTPGGVALQPPSPLVQKWASFLLSPQKRFAMFLKGQLKKGGYLQPGDIMTAAITTDDGTIDLGVQTNRIVAHDA
ncbi:fumarylacetoacetate hydrolase family protein [Aphanothece sacrum]|uniref:fumarylacetoacetate hydrolase family protein n=1 Tax=Aphanothece sacrum TaxID=1122 RepID=UPI000F610F6E|nr:fumarylacetoacetate hydrolase family protein [Aphanothece sacrum]GBF86510.1 FAH family protein [Aphanothece sacrum FPU3]